MQERLQKILSQAGIASRRKSEELIKEGKVTVNGKVAELGSKADKTKDKIAVNGKVIAIEDKVYLMLYKPQGFLSTVTDDRGRRTIMNLIDRKEKLFPVGRLDKDAEGLLLITNDGEWANQITHPSFEVTKTYQVWLDKELKNKDGEKLKKGIVVEGRRVDIKQVILKKAKVEITIHEGRKHIVKKIFDVLGYAVTRLKRTKVGSLELSGIDKGAYRELTKKEIKSLSSSR